MDQITTLTFFSFNINRFWGLQQMGLAQNKLKKIKDLEFYKFLGTGGGMGFSLWPDFSTYAFLGVWKNRNAYKKCLNSSNVFLEYKEINSKSKKNFLDKNFTLLKFLNFLKPIKPAWESPPFSFNFIISL